VGWLREELAAVGAEFETRGARTDETLEAMRRLWADDEATFSGATVAFERARSHPKPTSRSIPIEVGGHSRAAARRAGRFADTFHPLGLDDDALRSRLDDVAVAATAAGRDPAAIGLVLSAGPVDNIDLVDEAVARAERLGAARVVVSARSGDLDETRAHLDAVARRHAAAAVS
jgi:alkanesulfonate monooxygenase SsuD/methylene tetrahydromethanopterin reductase-like flavin-dependent oxidoreductase (luciferase family)